MDGLDGDIFVSIKCFYYRGAKTLVAGWHCHPESFCAFGEFLRVTLEIALGSFRTIWKIFQIVWIFSRLSGKFPDSLKVSRYAGYFLDDPESVWIAWKVLG